MNYAELYNIESMQVVCALCTKKAIEHELLAFNDAIIVEYDEYFEYSNSSSIVLHIYK